MIEKYKNILMVIAVLIVVMIVWLWFTNYNQNKALNELKVELKSAKEPSKVEIQKSELEKLETEWKNKENSLNELRWKFEKFESEKLELEPKIQEKRRELLWIKPVDLN
jgi:septal ring factor EnvC (AmiA/AmiB activator)